MQRQTTQPNGVSRLPQAAAPVSFSLVDLSLIHRGNLLARARLLMPSGMIVSCSVLRNKKDPESIFVMPVAERLAAGGYANIVDFASPELRDAWQAATIAALRPRWRELLEGPSQGGDGNGQF